MQNKMTQANLLGFKNLLQTVCSFAACPSRLAVHRSGTLFCPHVMLVLWGLYFDAETRGCPIMHLIISKFGWWPR